MKWLTALCAGLVLVGGLLAQTNKPLSNNDVIEMLTGGFDEETVILAIEANEAAYDTSVQGLVGLKNAGVSQKVIGAILSASKRGTEAEAAPAMPDGIPEEIGVYLKATKEKESEELVEVIPEIVTWKTGGFLKSMATAGLTKGHVNGVVKNAHSPLQVSTPLEFIIRCPEGVSAAEYQLLDLDEKDDRREFRAVTGGIIHASGGADKNAVDFDFEKIASRTFRIKLAKLKKGEYGILPPGAVTSQSTASVGKMYTFGVE